jgi:hypothetical protein
VADRAYDYLVPINGLTITGSWQLGSVTLLDTMETRRLIAVHPSRDALHPLSNGTVDEFAAALEFASAHVLATTSAEAVDLARTAVELLRVFQQSQSRSETTMFGLPGELHSSRVDYLVLGDRAGVGWTFRGHHPGWTFTPDQVALFESLPGFEFAAQAIGKTDPSEGENRALLASRLTSQAILEQRPSMKLLYSIIAAETLLLDRSTVSQSFRLARRSVYFLCGQTESKLCGRERPTCTALANTPETSAGRKGLAEFRGRGRRDVRWRCSEWHHVLDWYDARSDVVHGGGLLAEEAEAGKTLFWLVTRLVPSVFQWLSDHPDDPLSDLEAAIESLPDPPDWEEIISKGSPQP